jgi:hypothetical protein
MVVKNDKFSCLPDHGCKGQHSSLRDDGSKGTNYMLEGDRGCKGPVCMMWHPRGKDEC